MKVVLGRIGIKELNYIMILLNIKGVGLTIAVRDGDTAHIFYPIGEDNTLLYLGGVLYQ